MCSCCMDFFDKTGLSHNSSLTSLLGLGPLDASLGLGPLDASLTSLLGLGPSMWFSGTVQERSDSERVTLVEQR
jgi:hypothetical protein